MTYEEARTAWCEECADIAEQCRQEGYPSHGSTYELRAEEAWRWYAEQIDEE